MEKEKRVSVVIMNWNGRALLEQFLPSVTAYTPADRADVIVADNGSTDGSTDWLRRNYPTVGIIAFDRNWGFAEGYNRALEQIDTEYAVLLNSDVEVTPGWIDAPLDALDADPQLAGVQPKIRAQRQPSHFEYAGAAGGWIDSYGYPFCRGRILGHVEADKGQYDTPADIFWATGACLFIRTALYRQAGGLDRHFFAHQEEIDLCWRLRARGYRLICTPQSVVYHVGGSTLSVESPHKTFLNFRNNLLMLYKNLPDADLQRVMRLRRWLDYAAGLHFLLGGHVGNAWAVVRARRAYHRLKPTYRTIREANRMQAVRSSYPEMLPGCLLAYVYLKGRKTFAALTPLATRPK